MKRFLLGILILVSTPTFAQTLSGKVLDELNQPMPFSTIMVKGTTIGTTSDFDGLYSIELPSENVVVIFSFIGYEPKEVTTNGGILNVQLEPLASQLDEVFVTARRSNRSESVMVLEKKNIVGVETSIGGEELSKKGISNVEDGLKKVSGVTFNNNRINVRGLDDRYNQITLNGIPLPSNNSDKKNIDLNILPTAVTDNVKVRKSYSSEQWSNIAGAQIDISSSNIRNVFDVGYRVSLNSQTPTPNSNLSLQWGKDGDFGIYYAFNLIQNNQNRDGVIRLVNKQGNNVLDYSFEETETQLIPSSILVLSYMKNKFDIKNTTIFITQIGKSDRETFGKHFDYTTDLKTIRITPTQHTLFTNQLKVGYGSFDLINSYSRVVSGERDREQYVFLYDGQYQFNNIDRLDNHLFNSTNVEDRFNTTLQAELKGDKLNHLFGFSNQISINQFDYTQQYYDLGVVNSLYQINPNNYSEYINDSNTKRLWVNNPASKVDGYTMINGGFYKGDYISDKLDLSGGVRVENPLQIITYKDQFSPTFTRQNRINEIEVLPYLNSKVKFNEKVQLKTSTSITTIRPRFRELTPFIYTEVFAGSKIQGNPDLVNSKVYNGDLTFEYFPSNSEVIALTLFGKRILNPIERVNVATASGRLETYQNSVGSNVYGLEFEMKKKWDMWSVDYNLSLLQSDIEISQNTGSSVVVTNLNRPLQGSTPILSNLDVFYNVSNQSNIGLTYNYVGEKLFAVGIFGLGDIYQTPQHLLNAIWNLEKDKYNLSFRLNNILNTPFELTQQTDIGNIITNRFTNGVDASIRFTYKF